VCVIILVLKEYALGRHQRRRRRRTRPSDSPNCSKKHHLSLCDSEASVQVPLENMIRRNQNSISLTSIAQAESIAPQKALFGSWLWIQYRCCACNGCCSADGTAAPPRRLLEFLREFVANCAWPNPINRQCQALCSQRAAVVCRDKNNWKLRGTSICWARQKVINW
jgi:hypothetical protein